MKIRLNDEEGIEVQMAPLIDCVFLLLIFFLVATTLKKIDHELPVELPDSAAALEVRQTEDMFVVGMDAQGQFYIDAQKVTQAMLRAKLQELAAADTGRRIRIDADRMTPFQNVVHVFDLCHFEGLKNVGIHTRDK